MDSETKAKWVAALRSDEYKQGRGCLRSEADEFCCLGVLADILDHKGWRRERSRSAWSWRGGLLEILPEDVLNVWVQSVLTEVNDDGTPFSTIADWIEKNL